MPGNSSLFGARGGKGDINTTSTAKSQKRDYDLVSPPSPEGQLTLTNMRALLKEAMDPIYIELDAVKCKLEQVTTVNERVTNLEEELKSTKAKLE